jgi:uncharacterized protein
MTIVLPILHLEFNLFYPLLIGFIGGLLTGVVGIGGGIFVTPALIASGVPPLAAVACQVNSTVGVALTGFLRYRRNHDVDMRLGWLLVVGGVSGAYAGVKFLDIMPTKQAIDQFINFGYITITFLMGTLFLKQSLKNIKRLKSENPPKTPAPPAWVNKLPWPTHFRRTRVEMSGALLIGVGMFGGFITATLGMGNGVFLMPMLTYLIGRTSPVVYGTTLFCTVATTIASTLGHSLETQSIDLVLVMLLVLGGIFGNQLGVRLSYLLPRAYLGFAGALLIYLIGLKFLLGNFQFVLNFQLTQLADHLPPFMEKLQLFAQSFPYEHALLGIAMVIFMALFIESMIKTSKQLFFH